MNIGHGMKIPKENSAVVLIEFQKQWTEKNLYRCFIDAHLKKTKAISNTLNFVSKARNIDVRIIHAPLIIDPQSKRGILAHVTWGQVFTKNTWKSELVDGIYKDGDVVVAGRYGFDAFVGSTLEKVLRNNRIENVFLCGFVTDQCIAKTLRTALLKDFNAFLVSDCTATLSEFLQKRTERKYKNHTYTHEVVLNSWNY